jgi:hypothetical protein
LGRITIDADRHSEKLELHFLRPSHQRFVGELEVMRRHMPQLAWHVQPTPALQRRQALGVPLQDANPRDWQSWPLPSQTGPHAGPALRISHPPPHRGGDSGTNSAGSGCAMIVGFTLVALRQIIRAVLLSPNGSATYRISPCVWTPRTGPMTGWAIQESH